ncbi:thioesterase atnL [Apiospora phragmitis]|uniref:Thioesterase atnL n=1 Tax=Apiospora phragmitis TaxID=2905665 RepID=A0ABR1W0X3_9PEZI
MDRISVVHKFLDERSLLPMEVPECVLALVRRLQLLSYWELAALASVLGFAAANLKALPLAHSLRLLPSLGRLFAPRLFGHRSGKARKQPSNAVATAPGEEAAAAAAAMAAAHPPLFRHHTTSSRAIPLDLDLNMHKSNSTFFADADVSRAALLTSMLSDALAARGGALFVLAGTQCKFLREIRPLQAYAVASQVLAWTDKALYTVTYFVSPRRGDAGAVCGLPGGPNAVLKEDKLRRKVFAILVSKYVFKAGRATVAPAKVFDAAGLLLLSGGDEKELGGKEDRKEAATILSAEEVEEVVQNGMQFVRDCML